MHLIIYLSKKNSIMSPVFLFIIISAIVISFALPFMVRRLINRNKNEVSNVSTFTNNEKTNSSEKSNDQNKVIRKSKNKNRLLISFLVPIIFVAIPILISVNSCESDYSKVTFAIENKGKNFIYNSNEFLVNQAILENEVPTGFNNNIIYFIDQNIYMSPNNLEGVINILSGNYRFIEQKEPSYDGYAVKDTSNVYNFKVQNKAGSKIGEVHAINIVTLTDKSHRSKNMEIKWRTIPDLEAIQNCSVESIWVVTNPYPGKTVGNWEDDILVNIDDINAFYGNLFELVFDEEASVLYFKKSSNI